MKKRFFILLAVCLLLACCAAFGASGESGDNPVHLMDNTTAVAGRLRDLGAEVVFEENPGGHTHEADRRMAKGIIALLK